MAGIHSDGTWRNWAGNQTTHPVRIERPQNEDQVVALVNAAVLDGLRIRAVGSGHSFTGIAATNEVLVTLEEIADVRGVDTATGHVRVGAGIRLRDLNPHLEAKGLAMPNLGDIDYQSVAGAIATSTHGTGLGFHTIADAVVGLRMVTGNGTVISCDRTTDPDLLHVSRVGLGALGIVTEVTLACVPAFNLHAIEEVLPVEEVVDSFDEWADSTDHTEFFWMPHTDLALVKRNTRTTEHPPPPRNRRHALRRRWKRFKNAELNENLLFGALNHLGRLRPSLIPRLNKLVAPEGGRAEYVTNSYSVFASPRRVRFYEMEYGVPRAQGIEAFNRVRQLANGLDRPVSFPVEYRVLAGDDIPLSTATGRDTAYIAVHVFRGTPHEIYFGGVEDIMKDYDGRPHWGKLHFQNANTLADLYPEWDTFQTARSRLDPDGRFANPYLDQVLGPPQ